MDWHKLLLDEAAGHFDVPDANTFFSSWYFGNKTTGRTDALLDLPNSAYACCD